MSVVLTNSTTHENTPDSLFLLLLQDVMKYWKGNRFCLS